MPVIQWNQNLSVGVPEIDKQHQRLIKLINDLHEAMLSGKGNDASLNIVRELIAYTKTHFNYEIGQLELVKYPDLINHKAAHAALIKKVEEFAEKVQKGQPGVAVQLSTFLGDWLKTHIMGTDRKYMPFLAQKVAK
jgi:hemerythrin